MSSSSIYTKCVPGIVYRIFICLYVNAQYVSFHGWHLSVAGEGVALLPWSAVSPESLTRHLGGSSSPEANPTPDMTDKASAVTQRPVTVVGTVRTGVLVWF